MSRRWAVEFEVPDEWGAQDVLYNIEHRGEVLFQNPAIMVGTPFEVRPGFLLGCIQETTGDMGDGR